MNVAISGAHETNGSKRVRVQEVGDNLGDLCVASGSARATLLFTRPSNVDAYAAGDVVGPSLAATEDNAQSITGLPKSMGIITGAQLHTASTHITNGNFRVLIYDGGGNATAAAASAMDNDPLSPSFAAGALLGYIDFTLVQEITSTTYAHAQVAGLNILLPSTSFTLIVVAMGAYTPESGQQFEFGFNII